MVCNKIGGKPAANDELNYPLSAVRRTALSLAVAAALPGATMLPATALAQDDADDVNQVVEEVITYGKYRRSLMSSMEAKRSNSSIVEAISAEDIGKLPDVSIAESLARLPGLTVQRLNGRGQVVNIRGMSPDFSTGVLNGREQVSVGDNRGVEFDQYPSELLQQVVVYKTPDAAIVGQGLSGTVDMRTVRPLDYSDRKITLGVRFAETEYDLVSTKSNSGQRYSGTYIDQFADDTVGIVVGAAYTSTPNFGQNSNVWGYYLADPNGNVAAGGGRTYARASELERTSFVAGLDWKPTDDTSVYFDAFVSTFEEDQIKHGFVFGNLADVTATATRPIEAFQGYQLITEGEFATSLLSLENNLFKRDADLQSFGLNIQHDFGSAWTLGVDVSYSGIDRSDIAEFESNSSPGGAGGLNDTVTFRTDPDGRTVFGVSRDYTNIDYSSGDAIYATSPYGWGDQNALAPYVPAGQFGYNKVFDINDDLTAFRVELERELDWGWFTGVGFGYNLTSRDKDRVSNEGVITSGVIDPVTSELATEVEIPANITGTVDLGWGMLGSNTSVLAYNPLDLLASGQIQQGAYLYDDILAKAWVVEEDVHTAFVKFELDGMLGKIPVTGNVGLQYQYWDQSSSGSLAFGAGAGLIFEPLAGEDTDSEPLPSLNLIFELTENQRVRFSLARTLARPRMDEMKASSTYTYNETRAANFTQADVDALIAAGTPEITAYDQLSPWKRGENSQGRGNPELKPWKADGIDLSYEYYFPSGGGYLAAAAFYKDLKTYIYNQTLLFDFTGVDPGSAITTDITVGTDTRPANGEGGHVSGWELTANIAFDMFARPLNGFGLVGTYSRNDSNIEPNGPGSASKLPGLSETVWNLTLYYERYGFSARVNQRYRSDYIGEVSGFGGSRTGSDIEDETVVDAQISYEFQSGPLQGLSILLEGQNLTDEPFRTIYADNGLPNEYQTFGATYQLGFSYSID